TGVTFGRGPPAGDVVGEIRQQPRGGPVGVDGSGRTRSRRWPQRSRARSTAFPAPSPTSWRRWGADRKRRRPPAHRREALGARRPAFHAPRTGAGGLAGVAPRTVGAPGRASAILDGGPPTRERPRSGAGSADRRHPGRPSLAATGRAGVPEGSGPI